VTFGYHRVVVPFLSIIPAGLKTNGWAHPYFGKYEKVTCITIENYLGITILPYLCLIIALLNSYWTVMVVTIGLRHTKNGSYTSEFEGEKANNNIK